MIEEQRIKETKKEKKKPTTPYHRDIVYLKEILKDIYKSESITKLSSED